MNWLSSFMVCVLIVIFPISHVSVMPQMLFGVSGANPINLIWIIVFLMVIADFGRKQLVVDTNFFKPGLTIFLAAFFLAVFWTALTPEELKVPPGYAPYETSGILISSFFKSLQVLLTGWLVYRHCLVRGHVAIENSLLLIPIVMLPFVIYFYFYGQVSEIAEYMDARERVSGNMGLHANELGGLILIIVGYAINRKVGSSYLKYASLIAALVVIAFSLSRMAYLGLLAISILSFRLLSNRQRLSLLLIGIITGIALSPLIVARLSYNLDDTKNINVNDVSANRVDMIWVPSLKMIRDHPVVGQGYLSIWKGDSSIYQKYRLPSHPHNAYLQVCLDLGVLGLFALIGLLVSIANTSRLRNRSLYYALFAWTLMGLTGFSFYPEFFTFPLWLFYGLSCALPLRKDK